MDLNDFEDIESERQRGMKGSGQKIREAELGRTRNILLFIGILSLAMNGYMFANSRDEVAKLGLVPAHAERVLILVRIIYGVGLALGTFFTVAGILIKKGSSDYLGG